MGSATERTSRVPSSTRGSYRWMRRLVVRSRIFSTRAGFLKVAFIMGSSPRNLAPSVKGPQTVMVTRYLSPIFSFVLRKASFTVLITSFLSISSILSFAMSSSVLISASSRSGAPLSRNLIFPPRAAAWKLLYPEPTYTMSH